MYPFLSLFPSSERNGFIKSCQLASERGKEFKKLEKIVCAQVTEFFEVNNLLPNNQHGFRSNKSTMTARCEMQENLAQNYEDKNMGFISGV